MKRGLAAIALAVTAHAASAQTTIRFGDLAPGALPASWQTGVTGKGAANWQVTNDTAQSRSRVLKQSGDATFCWAVKSDVKLSDGFVETKFKPVDGKEDQAGGIVFRFQDGKNYYVVRANALEDNVVLYKTVDGKRSSLPVKGRLYGYGVDVKVPTDKWGTLRVDFEGSRFLVAFNGKRLFEVEDDTFRESGAVGLWTKADSVTVFDKIEYGGK
ncbi:MAG TPA: hypothetical protein PKM57_16995 [Kiritimatiellia bacterium]|nr:hypothetical protein [Kiritimatiellia bacterium]HPS08773.1 hypothetical protein [Kiritimatiellia bacterium]